MTPYCLKVKLKPLSLLPYLSALDHQVPLISKHANGLGLHMLLLCLECLSSTRVIPTHFPENAKLPTL